MAKVPPRNPKYSAVDLWPPGSKGNVDFPPAAFFPVYLGNFLCQQQGELVSRVQQYFAAKGLLARMVFVRSAQNDAFRNYQDRTKLYDCLVYFTRELDALDAVKYLHRDKYHGHRLNIFPGRDRHYFSPNETVEVIGQLPGVCDDAPAQMYEDEIRKAAQRPLACGARNAKNQVLLEFRSRKEKETGVSKAHSKGIRLMSIKTKIAKQRFIEADIGQEIRKRKQFAENLPHLQVVWKLEKRNLVTPSFHHTLKKGKPAPPGKRPRNPTNHDHVIQAMKRIIAVAAQRQLDIGLYRAMFPNAYKQFMAILQASIGDKEAAGFLQTYVAPWQFRQNQLNPWEWMHVQLHNEGLDHIHSVIRQRQANHSK
uniref:Uncharacterized protein n=1 Tax=Culex tarsalis TaxID=7177 RepID=A0A1Q3EX71_CULTA